MKLNWLWVFQYKCPKCGEGNMFPNKTYSRRFYDMETRCSVCSKNFVPESGFYTGAMYFSYAINVALSVFFGVGTYFIAGRENLWLILIMIIIPAVLLVPLTYRISRALMLHIFG